MRARCVADEFLEIPAALDPLAIALADWPISTNFTEKQRAEILHMLAAARTVRQVETRLLSTLNGIAADEIFGDAPVEGRAFTTEVRFADIGSIESVDPSESADLLTLEVLPRVVPLPPGTRPLWPLVVFGLRGPSSLSGELSLSIRPFRFHGDPADLRLLAVTAQRTVDITSKVDVPAATVSGGLSAPGEFVLVLRERRATTAAPFDSDAMPAS